MTYSNKFVMCVMHKGKPVEDRNGRVVLPFEEEFALRFRNKHNRRAVVKFFIDGEEVSGPGYIVPAQGYIDIERHHDVARKFKFVSLDSGEAIEHGKNGDNPDKIKGTIEARFYLEKELPAPPTVIHHHHTQYVPTYPYYRGPVWGMGGDGTYRSKGICGSLSGASLNNVTSQSFCDEDTLSLNGNLMGEVGNTEFSVQNFSGEAEMKTRGGAGGQSVRPRRMHFGPTRQKEVKDGATVEGNLSSQRFTTSYIDIEDSYTTLKLFLQGHEPDRVTKPVYRVQKPTVVEITEFETEIDETDETSELIRKAKEEAQRLELQIAEMKRAKLQKELEKLTAELVGD